MRSHRDVMSPPSLISNSVVQGPTRDVTKAPHSNLKIRIKKREVKIGLVDSYITYQIYNISLQVSFK